MSFVKGHLALHSHLKALLDCDDVVCCSKTICDKMSKDYPNKEFCYIQNGVDVDKYKRVNEKEKKELRKKYNFNTNDIIYISTGSFIPRKRIEETIKGFLASKTKDVLLLLGDGMLYNGLKSKYGNHKNIVFYGKSDKVVELLQLSDFFISSSESEGLPNGVIEALACGLPVILSDIPQHKEVLNEFKDVGICYRLGDIKELSHSIQKTEMLNNEKIENSPFTMINMSKSYVKIYDKIGRKKENDN